MTRISPLSVYMGVGAAGAFVDVSSKVLFVEGLELLEGKQEQFRDTDPGSFSFLLENYTGDFTPDNPSSSLATKLTERTPVTVQVGSKVREYWVQSVGFASDEVEYGLLRIVCDDMLGAAARNTITTLDEVAVLAASPRIYYPLTDAVGSLTAAEKTNPTFTLGGPTPPVFGQTAPPGLPDSTQMLLSSGSMVNTVSFASTINGFGWINGWLAGAGQIQFNWPTLTVTITSSVVTAVYGSLTLTQALPMPGRTDSAFYSVSLGFSGSSPTTFTMGVYVNGVLVGTRSGTDFATALTNLTSVVLIGGAGATFSHISLTPTQIHEELGSTEAARLTAIDYLIPEISLSALPAALSPAPIGVRAGGGDALDLMNEVMRGEQGYMYQVTTGTVTAPSASIKIRERVRPAAVTYSFDAVTEVSGVVPFVREITNLVSSATAVGPTGSRTATDSTLVARAGSANTSDTVLFTNGTDLLAFASDRLNRGKTSVMRAQSIIIDALTTSSTTPPYAPNDRSADLLAMAQGDRIRITNLYSPILGFTTWDGFLIGRRERHTLTSHSFELFLAPCPPSPGLYGTALYSSGGLMSLSGALTAGATSMTVVTDTALAPLAVTGAGTPYALLIDQEQVIVTAATPTTATITRGANGTVAAAHLAGALVDVPVPAVYGY